MLHLGYRIRNIDSDEFYKFSLPEDRIKFLLRYAILAPSTHNSQPWLLKIKKNSCQIYLNPSKRIVEADPIERDLYISFGCFLENLVIAGNYFGVFDRVEYFDKRSDDLVAEVFFRNLENGEKNLTITSRLEAILKRVNARGVFEKREIGKEILEKLIQLNNFPELQLHIVQDSRKIQKIARLTSEGLKFAYASLSFRKEMSSWMNSSFSRQREGIPGYSLRIPALISLIFPTLVRFFNLSKWVAILNHRSISSAPIICIISAKENSPIIWMKVGRLFERMTLELNISNIKTSVFVASIEMGNLYTKVQSVLSISQIPQMLFCAGYMNFNQRPNLRYSVESKIMGDPRRARAPQMK